MVMKIVMETVTKIVMDPSVTLARKVGPGLQDLQKWGQRILVEKNAKKAEENTWIGWMVAAESLEEIKALIKSHGSMNWTDQLSQKPSS